MAEENKKKKITLFCFERSPNDPIAGDNRLTKSINLANFTGTGASINDLIKNPEKHRKGPGK
ncbi:hypothetical protein C0583_02570 [Candidatus Parcubacteria bacterium]|nr:MAG: hypothetical protein C0583_02570 [Candidatus Parcubacteria bacterium]